MKIQAIKNYYTRNIKSDIKHNSEQKKFQKASEPIYFKGANSEYEITGIGEDFFDSLMKNVASEKEVNDIKKSFLLVDDKYSPQLGMLFVQTFNYGADRRKKDSPGMSQENKNKFALEFATNVFYANKDINGKHDFSNFQQKSDIIYKVQKSGLTDEMLNFIFCSKDEKTEKFIPDVAKTIFKITSETNYKSSIDIRFYIEDYCRDLDGNISDDNVDSLINLMKIVGPEHVDAYSAQVFNKETKEFMDEPIQAIQTMLDYFLSEECKNKNYKGFVLDVGKFMFVMLSICKNPDTNSLDKDLFDSYFQDIRFAADDDFQKMLKKLFHPGEEI